MHIIEYRRLEFDDRVRDRSTVRTYATTARPLTFTSLVHAVFPTTASVTDIWGAIATLFPGGDKRSIILLLQFDKSRSEWRDARDKIVLLRRFMSVEIVQTSESGNIGLEGACMLGGIEPEVLEFDYYEIDAEILSTLHLAVHDARRRRALCSISYYKGNLGYVRDLQHANLIDFLMRNHPGPFRFGPGGSIVEVGPALGFVYRYAQTQGVSDVTVIEKNTGFCAIALLDGVERVLNADIADPAFPDLLDEQGPDRVDTLFAKGVLNIYAFENIEHYRKLVSRMTALIRRTGVWITYNVDRDNGPEQTLFDASHSAFEDAGWQALEIPHTYKRPFGVNFMPEVDWSVWVYDAPDGNRSEEDPK